MISRRRLMISMGTFVTRSASAPLVVARSSALGSDLVEALAPILGIAPFDLDRPSVDVAEVAKTHVERVEQRDHRGIRRVRPLEQTESRDFLGVDGSAHACPESDDRGRRPRTCQQRASSHGITCVARVSTDAGIVSPSSRAVRRLMMMSNSVGCSTGISAGFAPFKMRSTKSAARRNEATPLVPKDINPPLSTKPPIDVYEAGIRRAAA